MQVAGRPFTYLPKQGIEPGSPELQADSLPTEQSNYTPIKNNLKKKETS